MTGKDDYRFPGSRAFTDTEHDRKLFFGRDFEEKYLLHLILMENLCVVFAKSGVGKTSLINAGLLPRLRDEALKRENRLYFPLTIRFNNPGISPLSQIYREIEKNVEVWNKVVLEERQTGEKNDNESNSSGNEREKIDYEEGERNTLWEFFKTVSFWSGEDTRLSPVLILDQFEEFFKLNNKNDREDFIEQFADLVNGRVPKVVREAYKNESYFPYTDSPPNVKIIISIRQDFFGYLEEMTHSIPHILKNRFMLKPLTKEQARKTIIQPAGLSNSEVPKLRLRTDAFSFSPEAVEVMLGFLGEQTIRGEVVDSDEIDPAQLQIICQYIERCVVEPLEKKEGQAIVKLEDLGGKTKEEAKEGMNAILKNHYSQQVCGLGSPWMRKKVFRLCEKGLLDDKGRLSLEENFIMRKFRVPRNVLAQLVDLHLLRSEPGVGARVFYELSHDTLVKPIREIHRTRVNKSRWIWGAVVGLIISIVFVWGYLDFKKETEFNKMNREAVYEAYLDDDPVSALRKALEAHEMGVEEGENLKDRTVMLAYEKYIERYYTKDKNGNYFMTHNGPVYSAMFSPDNTTILTCSQDGTAKLWDWNNRELVEFSHREAVVSAIYSPDGKKILTASVDGTAKLWNLDGRVLADLNLHNGPVWMGGFAPDGSKIVTASDDGTAVLWDLQGRELMKFSHKDQVYRAVFSPDGNKILTASGDHTAVLWSAATGERLVTFRKHRSTVWWVDFSPDGKKIVTASQDKSAVLWDLDGNLLMDFPHQGAVTSARFAPLVPNYAHRQEKNNYSYENTILTCSDDGKATIWRYREDTKPQILFILEHDENDMVTSAVYSAGLTRIVTSTMNGNVKIWNDTGKCLKTLTYHGDAVNFAGFSSGRNPFSGSPLDNAAIVSASQDGTARLYLMTPEAVYQWLKQKEYNTGGRKE